MKVDLTSSQEWWEKTRNDKTKLFAWLKKQYHGEVTAGARIDFFSKRYCKNPVHQLILKIIARQERKHAIWVGELLITRGIAPELLNKKERYWDETLPGIEDFATGAAVASHAERMRLERIQVIAMHPETPKDIKSVFISILREELFHERAFAKMAGEQAMEKTKNAHARGRNALGLVN
ncbi:MAG: ferritin-like domain-containing protein [Candidatus Pacebacteria bacterium]|nr:ferritin-like domain-containing protein [Candidatus Paceibacterota bacterium]